MADEGTRVEVALDGGVRVEWDAARLAGFAAPAPDAVPERPWQLASAMPDWSRWDSMRILSAAFEDGALVAAAALRPRKAKGHDEDRAASLLVRDGAAHPFESFLVSVQRDGAGELRRVNVEAYLDEDGVPLRLTGDVIARESGGTGADSLDVNILAASLSGSPGFATLDVLKQG